MATHMKALNIHKSAWPVFLFSLLAACGGGISAPATTGGSPAPVVPNSTTVTVSATPSVVVSNGTAVLSWSSTNSISCTSSPAGINGTAGTYTTPPLTTTMTYTVTCVGASGSASRSVTINIAPTTITSIAAAVANIIATPYLAGSTIRYLSDCQTGNTIQPATGCVQGSDSYDGTSPTIGGGHGPWQTTTKGASWLNSQTSGTFTLALAQGGVWNAAEVTFAINLAGNAYCPAGQTCSEVREYPQGGAGQKPVIYGPNMANSNLFFLGNGQRIMNLSLVGVATPTTQTAGQTGIFLYCNNCAIHDDSILNMDISGFELAISEQQTLDYNMTIQGNHFSNNFKEGYLGSSGNLNVNYNSFIDGGGVIDGTASTHSIYIAAHEAVTGVNIIGNYIAGYFKGPRTDNTIATQCSSGQFALHAAITNLVVSGNTVIEDTNAAASCWGLSANLITAAAFGGYFRNALFAGNIIVNGGNQALNVENCPYCVIENNLIIADNATAINGISAPPAAARTAITGCTPSATVQCYDDPSTNYTIRNNTIYFAANARGGMIGIQVGVAGSSELQTGHKVYNNTISYMATSASASGFNQVYCFDFPLSVSAYASISNNNCYVPHSGTLNYAWEQTTHDSLADWQVATSFDANSALSNPGFILSSSPYIAWSDSSLAAQVFNNGTTNIFSSSSALSGKGISGPLLDIAGASRSPTAPSIGAYE
jgi:hypothetical protein